MDFVLSEEQKMLQTMVRDVANTRFAPIADELDRQEEFPLDNFKLMAEMGLTGLTIPTEYGGSGSDILSFEIAVEEVARACASTADALNAHLCLATEPIYFYGNEQQRKKYLPDLASGRKIGAFAVTEPEAGSDISSVQTKAVRDGDHYIINGSKIFITNGDVADTVVAFVGVPALGKRGMTAFIVEKGMPGFSKGKKFHKLGMRAGTAAELIFEDCRVPVENRLGEEGQGMKIALATIDRGRVGIAAQALGITQAVLEKSTEYAKQRVQFGVPIAQNQAIAWKLADMATRLEGARLIVQKAAFLAANNEPFSVNISMGKLAAAELCMKAATEGIQIHGGYGYMMDSPMQRYFRDAKLTTIYEGTSEIQRLIISRALLK